MPENMSDQPRNMGIREINHATSLNAMDKDKALRGFIAMNTVLYAEAFNLLNAETQTHLRTAAEQIVNNWKFPHSFKTEHFDSPDTLADFRTRCNMFLKAINVKQ